MPVVATKAPTSSGDYLASNLVLERPTGPGDQTVPPSRREHIVVGSKTADVVAIVEVVELLQLPA